MRGIALKLSIVIPTLDEADGIERQVARCRGLAPAPEVIVADGGSRDGTPRLAEAAGARVILAPRRGRGAQMNAGVGESTGDVLLFLHADVTLPQTAWAALLGTLEDPAVVGGAFRRRFDHPSRLLALGCRLADARGRWLHAYLGDQAQFARRSAFEAAGGFPETLLFEDVILSRRLRRLGRTRLVPCEVVAAPRRFERDGVTKRMARDFWLLTLHALGADPDRLARRYDPRPAREADPGREGGSA